MNHHAEHDGGLGLSIGGPAEEDRSLKTLTVQGLTKSYRSKASMFSRATSLRVVDDVSLDIAPGQTLGLVGESGAGKSTVGRLALRLIEPDSGTINLLGTEISGLGRKELRSLRSRATMIFQDPYTSLNPRILIKDAIAEPLLVHADLARSERYACAHEMLRRVGLRAAHLERYPYELSGGQLQRVAIARALITRPSFIVCDEPVAALDISTQAQVINLLKELQVELQVANLFISHDLRLVRLIADEVAVMRAGKIVERGPAEQIFESPEHPYTQTLVNAVPARSPRARRFDQLS